MSVIKYKYVFLTFSAIAVLASIAAMGVWGLKLGIEFTGGSLLEVDYASGRPSLEEVKKALAGFEIGGLVAQHSGDYGLILRFKSIDEELHRQIVSKLASLGGQGRPLDAEDADKPPQNMRELRFDTIGATIGRELRNHSLVALALASIGIVLYIAYAFRQVSKPVSSWKYGIAAMIALAHDVVIPTGVFAFLGYARGIEIDSLFITALLTIMGFSVHDTIVVFDRTRENLRNSKTLLSFAEVVDKSIRETFARSLATSATVMMTLAAVFLFGGVSVKYFTLTLMIGIAAGTYSSIFVASPLLVVWHKWSNRSAVGLARR